ncbi:hypothetical protein Vsou_01560 [Vulcanisaeta souniana JCM 11219]|uniref:Uncharacterized protein n=1 Tax=Vulcanisaeta souniana JCM 11219 TaxID=1293586 RepID=A0ABN6SNP7_9CREN|nr:hypothetical protein Vsou_01560 [Vulcanisaeta souniana JCM 11219]
MRLGRVGYSIPGARIRVIVSGKVEFNDVKNDLSRLLGRKIENPGK